MNKILLLTALFIGVYLFVLIILPSYESFKIKNCYLGTKGSYNLAIHFISMVIALFITCIVGGLIL